MAFDDVQHARVKREVGAFVEQRRPRRPPAHSPITVEQTFRLLQPPFDAGIGVCVVHDLLSQ